MGSNLFLTIGALTLFGTLLVSTQNLISYNEDDSLENEYILAAYGAAQTVINEAKMKAFDENSVAVSISDTTALTAPGSLGPDAGEIVSPVDTIVSSSPFSSLYPGYPASVLFDDVDDYDGYTRPIASSRGFEGDTVRVTVEYVPLDNPDAGPAAARTFCKEMTVTVTGKYLKVPVTLSYGFTY